MSKVLEYQYTVQASDIDKNNHVNNVVYVQWVQNAAENHWISNTKEAFDDKYVWVVVRHEIDYLRQALLGDLLTIKTWIIKTERSYSYRQVEIYRKDKLICRAQTRWLLLSAETFKPMIIPPELLNLFN